MLREGTLWVHCAQLLALCLKEYIGFEVEVREGTLWVHCAQLLALCLKEYIGFE